MAWILTSMGRKAQPCMPLSPADPTSEGSGWRVRPWSLVGAALCTLPIPVSRPEAQRGLVPISERAMLNPVISLWAVLPWSEAITLQNPSL